jgi:Bacterial DNA-binding protein
MPASARLMVLMSAEERAALDAKARALGVSAGEIVRRAVEAFEIGTEQEAAELRSLIEAFDELHPETLRIADACHRKVAETLDRSSKREPAARHRKTEAAVKRNEQHVATLNPFDVIRAEHEQNASRAASGGRNPRSRESIKIAASKQPKYKAGRGLRDESN